MKKILLYTLGYLFTLSVMVTLGMLILHTWAVSWKIFITINLNPINQNQ